MEQFKDIPFVTDRINKSIGLIQNVRLWDEKDGLSLPDVIVFASRASGRNDVRILQNYLKQHHYRIPVGVFISYDLEKARQLKHRFELFDRVENLANAIRVLTHKDCNYPIHMEYDDSKENPRYFKPIYNVDTLDSRFFDQSCAIIKEQEIVILRKIFSAIDKLNFQDFKGFNKLKNALLFYDRACEERTHLQQLVDFFVVLESLFSDSEKTEITYKICLRTSYMIYPAHIDGNKRKEVFDLVKVGYNIRSNLLHGSDVEKFIRKRAQKDSYSFFIEYLPKLREIVDYSLKAILLDDKKYTLFSDEKLLMNDKDLREFFDSLVLSIK